MKQNRIFDNYHVFVRIVYRYYRRYYGKAATQDECLELFKIVFPEYYRANHSDSDYFSFSDKAVERMKRLFAKWKPEGPLELACDYALDQAQRQLLKKSFLEYCRAIMPVVMRIRKLTERECLRLQDVDEVDIDTILSSGVSRSAAYKLAGNSITVAPLFFIYKNLFITPTKKEARIVPKQLSLFG